MSDIFTSGPKKRKRKWVAPPVDSVKLSDLKEIVSFHKLRANALTVDGRKVKISREQALKFALKTKANRERYLPKGCDEVKDIPYTEIASVLFRYALVSLVQTTTGSKVYVPRETANLFDETCDDFMVRKVDQPWNDRRVFDDIKFSDIFKIVRRGTDTVRVMTMDGITILISKQKADAYEKWLASEGEEEAIEEGLAFLTSAPEKRGKR